MRDKLARQIEKRRSVLLDLDGTLLNTFEGITNSVIYALEAVGVKAPAPQELTWLIGPPLEESFSILVGSTDVRMINECLRHYRVRYEKQGLYEGSVYPGIPEALAELRESSDLFLATSKPIVYGREALQHYGLLDLFTNVYGSEFDGTRTQKDELIAYVLEKESLINTDTLMVGDRKYDILGAKANGVFSVGVTWGFGTAGELVTAGARILCDKTCELPELEKSLTLRRVGAV
jgi:phosphoglycolate phosphatase